MQRVIILKNFTTGGSTFQRGQVYWLHGKRDPYSIDLTNSKREFAVSVPYIDRDGNALVEIVSQQMAEILQKIQAGSFPIITQIF